MFGGRIIANHAIDFRRTLRTPWGGFYIAVLAGRERRSPVRLREDGIVRRARDAADAVLVSVLAGVGIVAVAALLYSGKMSLGIDLFDGDTLPDQAISRALDGQRYP